MQFNRRQLDALNLDVEFQRRVATDAVLGKSFNERDIDRPDEIAETLIVLGGDYTAGNVSFKAPSPAVISMLWLAKSPFLDSSKDIRLVDIDAALFVLTLRREAFEFVADIDGEFIKQAAGLCDKHEIRADRKLVGKAILTAIRHAFNAYRWLPETGLPIEEDCEAEYNAEWLTRMVAMVTQVSHYTPEEIKWDVSMLECGYLVIQNMRKNGHKGIAKKTRAGDCMKRLQGMMQERLKEMDFLNV